MRDGKNGKWQIKGKVAKVRESKRAREQKRELMREEKETVRGLEFCFKNLTEEIGRIH